MAKIIEVKGALLAPANKLTSPSPAKSEIGSGKTALKHCLMLCPQKQRRDFATFKTRAQGGRGENQLANKIGDRQLMIKRSNHAMHA